MQFECSIPKALKENMHNRPWKPLECPGAVHLMGRRADIDFPYSSFFISQMLMHSARSKWPTNFSQFAKFEKKSLAVSRVSLLFSLGWKGTNSFFVFFCLFNWRESGSAAAAAARPHSSPPTRLCRCVVVVVVVVTFWLGRYLSCRARLVLSFTRLFTELLWKQRLDLVLGFLSEPCAFQSSFFSLDTPSCATCLFLRVQNNSE